MLGAGIPGQMPPMEDKLLNLMTVPSVDNPKQRVLREGWVRAPAGKNAGKGNKQNFVSNIRSNRKKAIGFYMATLKDNEGQPVFPGFEDKIVQWLQRQEGEMQAPTSAKQSGSSPIPPPPF